MANKQFGQKDEQSGKQQQQQQGNLGQKDAREETKKESELSQMGETSRDANRSQK
jgi:hypothetical protein